MSRSEALYDCHENASNMFQLVSGFCADQRTGVGANAADGGLRDGISVTAFHVTASRRRELMI